MNARWHIKKSLEALDRTMKDPRSTPVDELNACLTFDRFRFFVVIVKRLKAENSCYYSVQTLLSSRLLFKNLRNKIYKTILLLVVLYGCEAWSLTLREESRLSVFENRILRRIFWAQKG